MSFKVYNAYKLVSERDPWQVLWEIQDRARNEVRKRLKAAYWDMMCDLDLESPEYKRWLAQGDPDWKARLRAVRTTLHAEAKENATSSLRSTYDLDVNIAVSPYKGSVYLRAFCDGISIIGGSLNFLRKHPELKDFHYQNSTDRPKNVSAKEWKQREVVWEALCNPADDSIRHVTLDVCSYSYLWKVDPHVELGRKYQKTPPKFPSKTERRLEKLRTRTKLRSNGSGFVVTIDGHEYSAKPLSLEGDPSEAVWALTGHLEDGLPRTLSEVIDRLEYLGLPPFLQRVVDKHSNPEE